MTAMHNVVLPNCEPRQTVSRTCSDMGALRELQLSLERLKYTWSHNHIASHPNAFFNWLLN